ncbi:MAG: cobalamin biosynthesis protein CbiD [Clostridia bacterium]|nr:cobalamin biosynthesis protein CbiD [Clostridia bacterium]
MEAHFIEKDGKRLRFGYTTGTCAAAAAKAATALLLSGAAPETVPIRTPKGIDLTLPVLEPSLADGVAICAIRKDSGDDPDVTNGVLVYAAVSFSPVPGVAIDGGTGVGRVTKPGLKQAIGEAAINPVPREMIKNAVEEAAAEYDGEGGFSVVISIPEGVALAEKTFNPRLGIEGGISILGTSGVVEPMSEDALVDSIRLEIKQRRALGDPFLVLTPGNYGADFLNARYGLADERVVKCSNYVGDALDAAAGAGFSRVLLAGHIGKLVKLSGGFFNTHSRLGDHRAELTAAAAAEAGADEATQNAMFDCVTTDEMLRILTEKGLLPGTMRALETRIDAALRARFQTLSIGVIVFTTGNRELFRNETSRRMTEETV